MDIRRADVFEAHADSMIALARVYFTLVGDLVREGHRTEASGLCSVVKAMEEFGVNMKNTMSAVLAEQADEDAKIEAKVEAEMRARGIDSESISGEDYDALVAQIEAGMAEAAA